MGNIFKSLVLLCLLSTSVNAQTWGLGFRLGDPSGITVKKYWGGHAFEVSLGRTHVFNGPAYYSGHYDHWYEDQHFDYPAHEYLNYRASSAIGLQAHYLVQKDVKNAGGLDWYYGFGGQIRSLQYYYDYRYKPGPGPEWVVVHDEHVTEVDLGLDGVVGIEYKFTDAPIALFLDATLFMEVFDNPFVFWPQMGLGARYNFGGSK
ncbi:MAG: hypothetical protein ABI432_18060 [Flavobacteriales bacterium]